MPLKQGMNINEITDYLQNDLRNSVIDDVLPCINMNSSRGGYFGVPKLVLTYIDYLGALYHGYNGRRNKSGRRIIADGTYAKNFLIDVFGQIDNHYKKYGRLLWEIYRNGTVHLYEPLKLINSQEQITWLAYKGSRIDDLPNPYNIQVTHLVPYARGNHQWQQPLSIKCLYDDLLKAIDIYSSVVGNNPLLQSRFVQTADQLQIPENTRILWW